MAAATAVVKATGEIALVANVTQGFAFSSRGRFLKVQNQINDYVSVVIDRIGTDDSITPGTGVPVVAPLATEYLPFPNGNGYTVRVECPTAGAIALELTDLE